MLITKETKVQDLFPEGYEIVEKIYNKNNNQIAIKIVAKEKDKSSQLFHYSKKSNRKTKQSFALELLKLDKNYLGYITENGNKYPVFKGDNIYCVYEKMLSFDENIQFLNKDADYFFNFNNAFLWFLEKNTKNNDRTV